MTARRRAPKAAAAVAEAVPPAAPPAEISEVGFEVDPHAGAAPLPGETPPAPELPSAPEELGMVSLNWTPEQAGHLVTSLWNFGMLVWGPEWAAHPSETAGWNIYMAQLLDMVMPRGAGGYVELGAGLIMVGNGLAMMAVRRWPLIQQGPRPMWVRNQPSRPVPGTSPPTPAEPPRPPPGEGAYKIPTDLRPPPRESELAGFGL